MPTLVLLAQMLGYPALQLEDLILGHQMDLDLDLRWMDLYPHLELGLLLSFDPLVWFSPLPLMLVDLLKLPLHKHLPTYLSS